MGEEGTAALGTATAYGACNFDAGGIHDRALRGRDRAGPKRKVGR